MTPMELALLDKQLLSALYYENLSALLTEALIVINGEATLPQGTKLFVIYDHNTNTMQWLWSPTMTVANVLPFKEETLRTMLDGMIRALEWRVLRAENIVDQQFLWLSQRTAKLIKVYEATLVKLKDYRERKLKAELLRID